MAKKKKKATGEKRTAAQAPEQGAPRSTLHEVLRGRKSARHRPDSEKRMGQKLRRELQQDD